MGSKVLVAMSGGVDSSVAALLLKNAGYDVVGASLNLFSCTTEGKKSCCSAKDRLDAMRVCEKLKIPFISFDHRELFKKMVIGPFVAEYQNGRTPSPCILCNKHLKFDVLMKEASSLDASLLATGHYARVTGSGGSRRLLKGRDEKKDQSYFLFSLTQKELSRIVFPVGDHTKDEVRRIAKEAGLPTSDKSESQEICFVPDNDYPSFVEAQDPNGLSGTGNFVTVEGKVLGLHKGIHNYTIGQRRGLGFGVGSRQYVIEIRPDQNEVVLGSKSDLLKMEMIVRDVSWVRSDALGDVEVKIRSTHKAARAQLESVGKNGIRVVFREPQEGIAPGQAAVFYRDEEVLGGGWIA